MFQPTTPLHWILKNPIAVIPEEIQVLLYQRGLRVIIVYHANVPNRIPPGFASVNVTYFDGYFQFVLQCHLYYLRDSFALFLFFFSFHFLFLQNLLFIFKLLQTLIVLFRSGQNLCIYWIAFCFVEFPSVSVSPRASFSGNALNDFFRAFGLRLSCTHNQPGTTPNVLINSLCALT